MLTWPKLLSCLMSMRPRPRPRASGCACSVSVRPPTASWMGVAQPIPELIVTGVHQATDPAEVVVAVLQGASAGRLGSRIPVPAGGQALWHDRRAREGQEEALPPLRAERVVRRSHPLGQHVREVGAGTRAGLGHQTQALCLGERILGDPSPASCGHAA